MGPTFGAEPLYISAAYYMSSFTIPLTHLPVLFAAGGGGESHGVDSAARGLFAETGFFSFLTNSIFVAGVVTALILWFMRRAMTNIKTVPDAKQNLVETVVEFLYTQVENILGPKVTPQSFPLIATIFIYVTISNWFGLLPGVGTIFAIRDGAHVPLLRPGTADMNLTLGIALASLIVWLIVTIKEMGVGGTLLHIFGPKGGLKGFMKWGLMPVFFIVGIIEVVSILFRPVTLSLRLYGNIFAGENLLHTMSNLGGIFTQSPVGKFMLSILVPLPFYFMEILVGLLQGMVFAILVAVFIKLSTTHEEGHEGHDDHAAHH